MRGFLRWKKLREPATRAARHTAAAQSRPICTRYGGAPGPQRRHSGFPHRQERHKWPRGADEFHTLRLRAEANYPRRSKHTEVLFSSHSPPSIAGAGERGCYQALNICPSCKIACYSRPHKPVPLQKTFVEIGRVHGPDLERERDAGAGEDERQGNRLKTTFLEALMSWYGGEPPENWPPMPGSPESNVAGAYAAQATIPAEFERREGGRARRGRRRSGVWWWKWIRGGGRVGRGEFGKGFADAQRDLQGAR